MMSATRVSQRWYRLRFAWHGFGGANYRTKSESHRQIARAVVLVGSQVFRTRFFVSSTLEKLVEKSGLVH